MGSPTGGEAVTKPSRALAGLRALCTFAALFCGALVAMYDIGWLAYGLALAAGIGIPTVFADLHYALGIED